MTRSHFTRLFHEYGLPKRIRTDNGVPFASNALARLSTLSTWWVKLGIYPEQREPARPSQNGKHERMHRTLKKEATIPPEKNLCHQQYRFDAFRQECNTERPHEALGQKTPSSVYTSSPRRMPKKLNHFDYPCYEAISDSGGVPIKPQNPLDMSGAFIFAWLFFSFLEREDKNKLPPSGGEQK